MKMQRIVIYGPPVSGKGTLIYSFAKQCGLEWFRCTYDYDYQQRKISHEGPVCAVKTDKGAVVFLTVSGGVFSIGVWDKLVLEADGVVLVLNSNSHESGRSIASANYLADLLRHREIPGCIVCTKADQTAAPHAATFDAITRISTVSSCADWPVFHSRIDRPETMATPMQYMLKAITAPEDPSERHR